MLAPERSESFAVQTGDYVGEIFVLIEKGNFEYGFISIPKLVNRSVPVNKFDFAVREGIIEYVEDIPEEVFTLLEAQYQKNDETNN